MMALAGNGCGEHHRRVNGLGYTLLLVVSFFSLSLRPHFAQETVKLDHVPRFYLQMKNEDFLRAMVPKEKYLLSFVQTVNEEIWRRKSEGLEESDLNIEELVSPEERAAEAILEELDLVAALLDEIAELERRAKKNVDFRVLEALSELKSRVLSILRIGEPEPVSSPGPPSAGDSSETSASMELYAESAESSLATESFEDAFEQWKYNRLLDYKVQMAEYELLRHRLIETATPVQESRMFQSGLRRALETYSTGDFALARLQLRDVLETYSHYPVLDDVLYYTGEASFGLNYFDEAIVVYRRILDEYPNSEFTNRALVKLIFIHYIYGDFDRVSRIFTVLMQRKDELDSETASTVAHLVGYAHFRSGKYREALEALRFVPPATVYYYPSLYLSAACYSNLGSDDLALSIYHRLIDQKNPGNADQILAQIRNNAYLKLGLIYYERGENDRAIDFLGRITQDFQHYDLSVIGRAWSAYRSGRPAEALQNAQWLLHHSMVSNYLYEARVLAATSKQLLGHSEEAIEDLQEVLQVGKQAENISKYSPDRTGLVGVLRSNESSTLDALQDSDRDLFAEIEGIRKFLYDSAMEEAVVDAPPRTTYDAAASRQQILNRIEALDLLEEELRESGSREYREEIRHLRSDLLAALKDHEMGAGAIRYDPEEDPLINRLGMSEYMKYSFRSLLMQTLREKQQTLMGIEEAEQLLEEARAQDKFLLTVEMEIKKEELEDYYGRLNQYEVWLRENFPQEFRIELDKWATFSGYGISNINFSRIKDCDSRIERISQSIASLDGVFDAKRKVLDNRIQGLLSDVAKIEEQMRLEAARREQKAREQFFRTEYFERQGQETKAGRLQEVPEKEKKNKE